MKFFVAIAALSLLIANATAAATRSTLLECRVAEGYWTQSGKRYALDQELVAVTVTEYLDAVAKDFIVINIEGSTVFNLSASNPLLPLPPITSGTAKNASTESTFLLTEKAQGKNADGEFSKSVEVRISRLDGAINVGSELTFKNGMQIRLIWRGHCQKRSAKKF